MIIMITPRTMENPTNSQCCVGFKNSGSHFLRSFNIWKRFAAQEDFLRCFPKFDNISQSTTTLTLEVIEGQRGRMLQAIIQNSMVGIKSEPMTKVPADLRLEAFLLWNYCCYSSDSDSLPRCPISVWLATAIDSLAIFPRRLPLWILFIFINFPTSIWLFFHFWFSLTFQFKISFHKKLFHFTIPEDPSERNILFH